MEEPFKNPFLEIQKQTEQKQNQRNQPAVYAVDNIKGGSLSQPKQPIEPKPRKKDYLFYLYPDDRELLNELASQAGFVTKQGKPNASAYFTAIIRQLGGADK